MPFLLPSSQANIPLSCFDMTAARKIKMSRYADEWVVLQQALARKCTYTYSKPPLIQAKGERWPFPARYAKTPVLLIYPSHHIIVLVFLAYCMVYHHEGVSSSLPKPNPKRRKAKSATPSLKRNAQPQKPSRILPPTHATPSPSLDFPPDPLHS